MTNDSTPKLCECGCGNPAPIAAQTKKRHGHVAGQPTRFIRGHYGRIPDSERESRPCACGCGEMTNVERSRARRFVHGHNSITRVITEADYIVEDRGYATSCWIWAHGPAHFYGYGKVTVRKKKMNAYAAMYRQMVGPIPAGLELDHLCRVPLCVRPDHLEPVTHAENVRRGVRWRRQHQPSL